MLSFFIRLLLHFSFSFITHAARCRSSSLLPFSFLSSDFVFFFSLVCPFLAALFPSSLLLSLAKPSLFQFLFFAYLFSAGQPCRSYSPETLSSMQNVCWVAPTLLNLINCSIAPLIGLSGSGEEGKENVVWVSQSHSVRLFAIPNIAAHWRTVGGLTKTSTGDETHLVNVFFCQFIQNKHWYPLKLCLF